MQDQGTGEDQIRDNELMWILKQEHLLTLTPSHQHYSLIMHDAAQELGIEVSKIIQQEWWKFPTKKL